LVGTTADFRRFRPRHPFADQSLALRKSRNGGSNQRSQANHELRGKRLDLAFESAGRAQTALYAARGHSRRVSAITRSSRAGCNPSDAGPRSPRSQYQNRGYSLFVARRASRCPGAINPQTAAGLRAYLEAVGHGGTRRSNSNAMQVSGRRRAWIRMRSIAWCAICRRARARPRLLVATFITTVLVHGAR
jgi:hypothetical protein